MSTGGVGSIFDEQDGPSRAEAAPRTSLLAPALQGITDTLSVCEFTGLMISLVCCMLHDSDTEQIGFTFVDGAKNKEWTWLAGVTNMRVILFCD